MDTTEAGSPAPGGELSGEATQKAAVKRLKKIQETNPASKHVGANGPPAMVPVPKS